MAKTIAMACGVNRYFAASVRKNTATKAEQIASVEISAGLAMPAAPSTTAARNGLPPSSRRYVFSMATVASSTRMPTASARPPRVEMLIVSPSAARTASDVIMDSGIETSTTIVARHDPRNRMIIRPVSPAAMAPSCSTSAMAWATNTDWSNSGVILMLFGAAARMPGKAALTLLTTVSVEALPFFSSVISTERLPLARTMFCWT